MGFINRLRFFQHIRILDYREWEDKRMGFFKLIIPIHLNLSYLHTWLNLKRHFINTSIEVSRILLLSNQILIKNRQSLSST